MVKCKLAGGIDNIMADDVRDMYLYIPDKKVTELAKKFGVSLDLHKAGMSRELVRLMPPQELKKSLNEYRSAAKGAVHLYEIKWEKQLKLTKQDVCELITKAYGPNIFKEERHPKLSEKPQVINAIVLEENKIMLQLAYLETLTRLVQYELIDEDQIVFPRMIIRLNSLYVEAHAGKSKSDQMVKEMVNILGAEREEHLSITNDVIEGFIEALEGKLILAKHKNTVGDYDTTEVLVSPAIGDLRLSEEYNTRLAHEPVRKKRIVFKLDPASDRVIIDFFPQAGTIWFRSYAEKRVVDYVFSQIAAITEKQKKI
jgi:hypothetical protein